jgi:hypothetical protein
VGGAGGGLFVAWLFLGNLRDAVAYNSSTPAV